MCTAVCQGFDRQPWPGGGLRRDDLASKKNAIYIPATSRLDWREYRSRLIKVTPNPFETRNRCERHIADKKMPTLGHARRTPLTLRVQCSQQAETPAWMRRLSRETGMSTRRSRVNRLHAQRPTKHTQACCGAWRSALRHSPLTGVWAHEVADLERGCLLVETGQVLRKVKLEASTRFACIVPASHRCVLACPPASLPWCADTGAALHRESISHRWGTWQNRWAPCRKQRKTTGGPILADE